jgi:hypothetical protein
MAQSIPKAHPQQVAWTFPTSLPENHSRPIDQTTIPIKLGTLNVNRLIRGKKPID